MFYVILYILRKSLFILIIVSFHVMIMEEDQDEDDVFIVMPMHFKDRISDLSEKSPPVDNTHFKVLMRNFFLKSVAL